MVLEQAQATIHSTRSSDLQTEKDTAGIDSLAGSHSDHTPIITTLDKMSPEHASRWNVVVTVWKPKC